MKRITNGWTTLLGLVLSGLWLGGMAQAMTIDLHLSDPTLTVGETFTLQVYAQDVFTGPHAGDEVLAFGFDLASVAPALFTFQGAVIGPGFLDDSGLFSTTAVAGSAFPGLPDTGSNAPLLLAELTFQAVGAGTSALGIVSDLLDFNEGLFYAAGGIADITASTLVSVDSASPAPVPEPGTLMLMGTGLVSLLGYGWRKRQQVA